MSNVKVGNIAIIFYAIVHVYFVAVCGAKFH